jgi:hypothetical protein
VAKTKAKAKAKRKAITADELLAALAADPEFVAAEQRREKERLKFHAEYARAEAPVVAALHAAGFAVESVWDLVNTRLPYDDALPILLEHIAKPYRGDVIEGIGRALAVRQAKFGWNVLMRLYRSAQDERAKTGLAVAIAGAADDEVIGDVIALARDTRHGPTRIFFLRALERSKDRRALAAMMELGTDPELAEEIQAVFRRQKRRKRRPRS